SQANGTGAGLNGGGGIENLSGATLLLFQTTVTGNRALGNNLGGGILNLSGGTLVLSQSDVSSNQTVGEFSGGGGIENEGVATLTNSFITTNQSPIGGG